MKHFTFEQHGAVSLGCEVEMDGKTLPISGMTIACFAAKQAEVSCTLTFGGEILPTGKVHSVKISIEFEDCDEGKQ